LIRPLAEFSPRVCFAHMFGTASHCLRAKANSFYTIARAAATRAGAVLRQVASNFKRGARVTYSIRHSVFRGFSNDLCRLPDGPQDGRVPCRQCGQTPQMRANFADQKHAAPCGPWFPDARRQQPEVRPWPRKNSVSHREIVEEWSRLPLKRRGRSGRPVGLARLRSARTDPSRFPPAVAHSVFRHEPKSPPAPKP